jgi:hypothetical protein
VSLVNTNINFPIAPFLDDLTKKPSLPWLLWLQNPSVVSLNMAIALGVTSGGTGLSAIPTNGQLLIGNGSGYALNTLTAGTAIGITNGSGSITVTNTGVTSLIAGSGISVSSPTGDVTVTNTGVLSFKTSLNGLTPSLATTGAVTLAGTLGISSGGTGQITASAAFNALSPITSTGDLILGNGSNSATRLGIGTNAYVLTSNGTTASWQPTSYAGAVTSFQTSINGLTPSTATTGVVTLAGTVGAISGGTGLSSYTTGDLLYSSATDTLSKRAIGTTGYQLTVASGVPTWKPPYVRTSFTATAGQTSFSATYNVGYVQVFLNGVLLNSADYTASSGTAVVLAVAANLNDVVELIAANV